MTDDFAKALADPKEFELTRLREENARLREASQAVVDCFGVGLDAKQLIANLAFYVGGLAAALGDEQATKALGEPS